MSISEIEAWKRAVGLGFVSGLRSMAGPALITDYANRHPRNFRNTPLEIITDSRVAAGFKLAAAGEIVIDKLPFVGSRISPPQLFGRITQGAWVGAAVFVDARRPFWQGLAGGAVGALLGSYAGYYVRRGIHEKLHIPDFFVAIAEDALTVTLGTQIIRE